MSEEDLNEIKILKQRLNELEKKAEKKSYNKHKIIKTNSPTYTFPSTIDSDSSDDEKEVTNSVKVPENNTIEPVKVPENNTIEPVKNNIDTEIDKKDSIEIPDKRSVRSVSSVSSTGSNSSDINLKEAPITLNKSILAKNHNKKENAGLFFDGDYIKIYTIVNNEKIDIIIPQDCPIIVKEKLSSSNTRTFQYILSPEMYVVELKKNCYVINTPYYQDNKYLFQNINNI
jgi:hypothetical protein